ncbi:MAG: SPFH domain-containing protein, partial [Chloroflexota bacterium]|nr:SPFH domain-containing protein [Chloroflexota bacterium]
MNRGNSTGGIGLLFILIALVFILGPFIATSAGFTSLSGPSQVILLAFGVGILIIGAIITTITRLYIKTSADQAFVRTGMGGQQPIIDGGALVVPVVHEIVPVSLQTMRLDVDRSGPDALITGDNLRADVAAEFYIKVQKIREHILAAATSLGERSVEPENVKLLVNQKLVSALRTVAATRPLHELHTKRDEFAQAVQVIVEKDLAHNGLTLESVTISRLDQTPPNAMRGEDNVFDAQGLRTIAEITQRQRVERNLIQREADQKVTAQDVTRDQFVFEQEVARANAAAQKDRNIQIAQAEAKQQADTVAAEQTRLAGVAQVKRDEAIQVAEVEMNQALEVANQLREQAAQVAEIDKMRTAELATRTSQIQVATKERDRAAAEAERFAAEARMEEERQAVRTVEVTQTAERDKSRAIIEAQAEFERRRLQEQVTADVAAYAVVKAAESAEVAATRDAAAQLTRAQADKEATTLRAEGERAVQMVPVDVERQRVEVERARVSVERQELENKAQFETISRDLQVDLARIEAEKAVRIAAAESYGAAMSNARMTVWGDPSTMNRMAETFFQGQQLGFLLDGAIQSTPDSVKQALTTIGQELLTTHSPSSNGDGTAPAPPTQPASPERPDR